MIELNLLPSELRKRKRRKIELPELPLVPLALGFVGILIVIQLSLYGLILWCNKQSTHLNSEWHALSPKKIELDKMKQTILMTDKKIKAIENLIEKRTSWSRLLNELSNSLTNNIWLNELAYTERVETGAKKNRSSAGQANMKKKTEKPKIRKTRILRLSGSAAGRGEEATTFIARFITSLKENEGFFRDFDDVELISIKKGSIEGHDVMNFTLACKFKAEER